MAELCRGDVDRPGCVLESMRNQLTYRLACDSTCAAVDAVITARTEKRWNSDEAASYRRRLRTI